MKYGKVFLIIFLSIFITTLGIGASDSWQGNSGSLLSQIIGSKSAICPKGMIEFKAGMTFSCVDEFEASASQDCVNDFPNSNLETTDNLNNSKCQAEVKSALPWVYINRAEATLACSRAGKRLPTTSEWYQFSLGVKADSCNIRSGSVSLPDKFPDCIANSGVKNTVGNVWEWTTSDVVNGMYNGRQLPGSGYVNEVDEGGVATSLKTNKDNNQFLNGYLWSTDSGSYGVLRGGFYSSRDDAGIYTVQAQTPTSFSGAAIGFRCVQ